MAQPQQGAELDRVPDALDVERRWVKVELPRGAFYVENTSIREVGQRIAGAGRGWGVLQINADGQTAYLKVF